jgi:hypothetical protein
MLEGLGNLNLVLYYGGMFPQAVLPDELVLRELRALGLTPLIARDIFAAIATLARFQRLVIPVGSEAKRDRTEVVSRLLGKLGLMRDEAEKAVRPFHRSSGRTIDSLGAEATALAHALESDPAVVGLVASFLGAYAKSQRKLAILQDRPSHLPIRDPHIALNLTGQRSPAALRRKADRVVTAGEPATFRFGILRGMLRHARLTQRHTELRHQLDLGEVRLVPKFRPGEWPKHPLMEHLKASILPLVEAVARERGVACDLQDLRYQTLFQLSTLRPADIFQNGCDLEAYLLRSGAFHDWQSIQRLDRSEIARFQLREPVVRRVIEQQLVLIQHRLATSGLPIERLLARHGVLGQDGLRIRKVGGRIAIAREVCGELLEVAPLAFCPLNPRLAKQYHRALHYIHSPRACIAFGLFVEGDEEPLSLIAFDRVDRIYKQDLLLMHGYDPAQCLDCTRLYSRPGIPRNTSSAVFGLAFDYLRAHRPEIKAVLSAHMPSYTSGASMRAGGFSDPVLLKPTEHRFVAVTLEGQTLWCHVTRRDQRPGKSYLGSVLPLLPTVELLLRLRPPRFAPAQQLAAMMVDIS